MRKRLTIVIIILLVIFGGTFGFNIFRAWMIKRGFAKYQPPPVAVSTTTSKLKTWHPTLPAVGTLTAVNGVNVSSEVSGQVVKIMFKSGEMVKQGRSLVQLDDAVDHQNLKNNLAKLTINKLTYERRRKVYQVRGVSKSAVDEAQAALQQSEAMVEKDRVMIRKKNIKAPFAGKIGIRNVNIGQYVKPGDPLVTLQSMDPLFVDFSLPEQNLKDLYTGQPITLKVEGYPGQVFKGTVIAINSLVDINTRSIKVRAAVPNKDGRLYPGTFADVTLILPTKKNVVTLPQTAVSYSLYGDSVYVVTQKSKDKKSKPILVVKQQFVKLGARQGNVIAITRGLKVGEVVVTSGQLKLRSGARVVINNTVKLTPMTTIPEY